MKRTREEWLHSIRRDYKHLPPHEHERIADEVMATHPDHQPQPVAEPWQPLATHVPEIVPAKPDRYVWAWRIAILLLLLVIAVRAHAQGRDSSIYTIGWTGNGISGTKTYAGPFKISLGTNMSGSVSGSTITLSASSTAATAFSGITAATNSNAGTFAVSGNTWDFTAATVAKLAAGTHFSLLDPTDATKIAQFDASGISTATTRTFTLPNASGALCLTSVCALQSTTVNGHALSANVTVTASDVGLGSVTNDTQTKAAIVPNSAPTAGQILVGNAGGTAYAVLSLSGDCTLASTGAITCTKTNGSAFATVATSGSASDLGSGTLPAGRMPALTGAVTSSAGAVATSPGKADALQANQYCADAGASDTYACNLSPAITAYTTGVHYWFKANTANTGAASINFNSVGACTIKKPSGGSLTSDLADNDIRAGQIVEVVYDGTNCEMASQLGNAPSGSGTVSSGSGYAIPAYGSAASTTVGPSNIVTDATGNNLTIPGSVQVGPGVSDDGTTAVNLLAKVSGGQFVKAGTSDTNIPVFIVTAESGSKTWVATGGVVSCTFDGATTANHYVGASGSTAGDCTDLGASLPTAKWIIGQVQTTNAAGGTYAVVLATPGHSEPSSGSGTVTSIATTSPITGGTITTTGTIACATCVTSAAALTNNQLVFGAGSQATAVGDLTGDVTTAGAKATTLGANFKRRGIGFSIGDPGGSALTAATTTTAYVTVPFSCTISAYNLLVDAGTITVKFWKVATGTAIPTSANSINTSGVSISSGTAIHSTTLTDFTTTSVAQNDIVAMNVTVVATAKYVSGVLECDQ